MITFLAHWIINSISSWGYAAIFLLMALESALVPIPSEVTMPFAGFLVGLGKLHFGLVVLIGALANLFGSLLAYALGYWGQEKFVRQLIKKYGKYLLVTYHEVETAEKWFRQKGELIAFGSRLLPVVRTFISLPAGFAQMNPLKFSLYTFLGALFWSAVLTFLGVILGENWSILEVYFRKFDVLILLSGLGLVVFYIWFKLRKFKKESASKSDE
jgi:membrane protein DedA with SNARE-associated domain